MMPHERTFLVQKRRKFLKEWPKKWEALYPLRVLWGDCNEINKVGSALKGAAGHVFNHSVWKRLKEIYQNPRGAAVFEARGSLSNFFKRKRFWKWFGECTNFQVSALFQLVRGGEKQIHT